MHHSDSAKRHNDSYLHEQKGKRDMHSFFVEN